MITHLNIKVIKAFKSEHFITEKINYAEVIQIKMPRIPITNVSIDHFIINFV